MFEPFSDFSYRLRMFLYLHNGPRIQNQTLHVTQKFSEVNLRSSYISILLCVQSPALAFAQRKNIGCISKLKAYLSIPVFFLFPTFLIHHFDVYMLIWLMCLLQINTSSKAVFSSGLMDNTRNCFCEIPLEISILGCYLCSHSHSIFSVLKDWEI